MASQSCFLEPVCSQRIYIQRELNLPIALEEPWLRTDSIYLEYLKGYFTSLWLGSHLHSGDKRSVSDLLGQGEEWARELESPGAFSREGSFQVTKYSDQKKHKIQVTELQVPYSGFEQRPCCICPGELVGRWAA